MEPLFIPSGSAFEERKFMKLEILFFSPRWVTSLHGSLHVADSPPELLFVINDTYFQSNKVS